MQTQQDLLNKIEQLKKESIELEKKNNVENKQKELLLEKIREFLEMPDCSNASILAIIQSLGKKSMNNINYYSKDSDKNLLLERKLINRFAREQEIRYEDSIEIIRNFLYELKEINNEVNIGKKASSVKNQYPLNAPIFFNVVYIFLMGTIFHKPHEKLLWS